MEQVTFLVDNKKDANLLISIAEKIGIKKHTVSKATPEKSKHKKLYEIIDAGVDVSNFGDLVVWQRETRMIRRFIK